MDQNTWNKTEHSTNQILHFTHEFAQKIIEIKHMRLMKLPTLQMVFGHGANISNRNMNEYRYIAPKNHGILIQKALQQYCDVCCCEKDCYLFGVRCVYFVTYFLQIPRLFLYNVHWTIAKCMIRGIQYGQHRDYIHINMCACCLACSGEIP